MQALLVTLKILGWFVITSTLGVLAFFLFVNYGLHPWLGVPYITFLEALPAFALAVIAFYLAILVFGTFSIAKQSLVIGFKAIMGKVQAAAAAAPAPASPAPAVQTAEVVK